MKLRSWIWLLVLALALPGATLMAQAAETAEEPTPNYQPMKVLGMQVWIDQETGQMRPPTAEEAAVLSAQMREIFVAKPLAPGARGARPVSGTKAPKQTQGVAQQQNADGTVVLEMGLDHLDFSRAHVDAQGELHFECGDATHAGAYGQLAPQPEEK